MNERGYTLAEVLIAAALLSLFWLQFVQLQRASLQRAAQLWQQFQAVQTQADRLLTGEWPTLAHEHSDTLSIEFAEPLGEVMLWPPE